MSTEQVRPPEKTSPLTAVWNGMKQLAESLAQLRDWRAFEARRVAEIEDRLARLDGGPDHLQAAGEAWSKVQSDRAGVGARPLSFELDASAHPIWKEIRK